MDPLALGDSRTEQLETLTLAVSYVVGHHAQCVAGTAILVRAAEEFGIAITPRAVGLVGQADGMPPLSSGTFATEFLKSKGAIPQNMEHSDDGEHWVGSAFRRSGHMIAFDETEAMVLDASFEQYGFAGMPNRAIAMKVDASQATWPIALSEAAFIVYLPDADDGGWSEQYALAYEAATSMAGEVAAHLASGGQPHTHWVRLDDDGAIVR